MCLSIPTMQPLGCDQCTGGSLPILTRHTKNLEERGDVLGPSAKKNDSGHTSKDFEQRQRAGICGRRKSLKETYEEHNPYLVVDSARHP